MDLEDRIGISIEDILVMIFLWTNPYVLSFFGIL